MLGPKQAITSALGVTVFGSASNRVHPDLGPVDKVDSQIS
jgi:hypothetical protein